jgi:S-formylglutathione hydrolase FrmB
MTSESLSHVLSSSSLIDGWIPLSVQVITGFGLIRAIPWRSRRWRTVLLPLLGVVGVAVAVLARWALNVLGWAGEPAPWQLWPWIGLSAVAVGVAVARWPGAHWSRRNLGVFVVSFCLLSTGLTINGWIGYVPSVYAAWNQVTAGPLPDEADWATIVAMQRRGAMPNAGAVVRVDFNADISGFAHRREVVYLPPAWFRSSPPPRLPVVMMIGGQFNTPADWLRAGGAIGTLDAFAEAHGGNAPVAVFVDPNGSFGNDTECVNGPRGNAATHLTNDVVPQVVAMFGTSSRQTDWGVVGFSSGGTCAVNLAVMHPNLFGSFVDIAGDLGPNSGTRAQTIHRLFGGDAAAWAAFDPTTVMSQHGSYTGVAGVFVVPSGDDPAAADALCAMGSSRRIACTVMRLPGRHIWPFAGTAFAATLPWLAGALNVPGVPVGPMSGHAARAFG